MKDEQMSSRQKRKRENFRKMEKLDKTLRDIKFPKVPEELQCQYDWNREQKRSIHCNKSEKTDLEDE